MTKKLLWDLFVATGKIEYYLKFKNWDEVNDKNNKTL